jgi:hypothetical protein
MTENSTVSFSRLSTYLKCPTQYKFKYLDKLEVQTPKESYFLLGTLAHELIEQRLLGVPDEDTLTLILYKWISEDCRLPVVGTTEDVLDDEKIFVVEELVEYIKSYLTLFKRCSAKYTKYDKIRNKDGSVPKDPINYPPTTFTNALHESGLYKLSYHYDNLASLLNPKDFKTTNFSKILLAGALYGMRFSPPSWVEETLSVEYRIDDLKVEFNNSDTYWNGAIDWVAKCDDGEIALIDHKTSKKKKTGLEVAFDPQLNLYAYIYHEHTGSLPKYIGINHLISEDIIVAEVEPQLVWDNLKYFESIQDAIDKEIFIKKSPAEYNSPCVKLGDKGIESHCPYLQNCWPEFFNAIAHASDI